VREELKQANWQKRDLAKFRKGGPRRVEIVLSMHVESTMTLSCIANRLEMGIKTHRFTNNQEN
jgi:hypothetical protein